MQAAAHHAEPTTTPAASERPASFFVSGPPRPRGRPSSPAPRRRGPRGEGELVFTTAATGWGEILTDPRTPARSWSSPTRWPATTASRARSSSRPASTLAALVVTRLVEPPAGPGISLARAGRRGRHPDHRGHRHPRADPAAAQRRGAARRRSCRPRAGRRPRSRARRQHRLGRGRPRHRGRHPRAIHRRAGRRAPRPRRARRLRREALAARGAGRARYRAHRPAAGRDRRGRRGAAPDLVVLSPGPGDPSRMAPQIDAVRRWRGRPSPVARRSSASASATSCWPWRRGPRRVGWRSATTAATTPCSRRATGGSTSAPTTTRSRSSTARRWRRPATGSATATSTTARSRGSRTPAGGSHRSSSTPRARRDRSTPRASSTSRWSARWRERVPRKVLVIGSGPILIGQAAEFDYAGVQACLALREAGVETILVNSNPATVMTDPDVGGTVIIGPLTLGLRDAGHRGAPARRAAADARRPDRPEPGGRARRRRRARALRRARARHAAGGGPRGRGPRRLPRPRHADRRAGARVGRGRVASTTGCASSRC